MSAHVAINPALLTWARERAGVEAFVLENRFPRLAAWEKGEAQPTLKQLEDFARAVHMPIGYFFLPAPAQEALPIADFRTVSGHAALRPSPDLLDALYLCQQRQDWYRDHARMSDFEPLDFIGSVTIASEPVGVAESMRHTLRFSLEERQSLPNWEKSLRQLVSKAEDAGVLVMTSGIVGSNSHRTLRVEEFRGFALADKLAPLIFVNGADSRAAQMFTLAHELAHLWLGKSGVSNTEAGRLPERRTERWCNAVAAEFLMPLQAAREAYRPDLPLAEETTRLARLFKVSTLVVLRRLFDAGFVDKEQFWQQYRAELATLQARKQSPSGGGDFYRSLGTRASKRFAQALLGSTLEGQTLFRDAFRLLGVKKSGTLFTAARVLGVAP
ncbi:MULTISPECIES: ImmA/IrrE family metallo-endopeptidase [unclassified Desulfovibrio]|uniref:ImmA/IrrE family metallo-endopeptidase n=1 Tax=unclassified Desulfovibrio TaxID=2593640 RepID=UPI000F5FF088|nr:MULTISPECIES: ImmA/IrrE family metallo-endopeptidase [unclassified Desulfovibrio]RRD70817.1 ImmA/IrrE family metallo-endopeptidase [Desulfovibrio sp. OH1209_COT-279]RRD87205.1 ImmA/IrrE family metallo-endopeptidase [Desulfovibrio sp. OH1186_COT-070]